MRIFGSFNFYRSKYIYFHFVLGSNYSSSSTEGRYAYYDTSKSYTEALTSENYYNQIKKSSSYISSIGADQDNYTTKTDTVWNTWYETNGNYKNKIGHTSYVEDVKKVGSSMQAKTTFTIPSDSFNFMKTELKKNTEKEEALKNSLGVSGSRYYYIRFSNILSVSKDKKTEVKKTGENEKLLRTAYDFVEYAQDWSSNNYKTYEVGFSGINNFDNILMMPGKVVHDRNVYVSYVYRYTDEYGVEHNEDLSQFVSLGHQYIVPGKQINSQKGITLGNINWCEKYSISDSETLHVYPRKSDPTYALKDVEVTMGPNMNNQSSVNVANFESVYINPDSSNDNDYVFVKFIYEPSRRVFVSNVYRDEKNEFQVIESATSDFQSIIDGNGNFIQYRYNDTTLLGENYGNLREAYNINREENLEIQSNRNGNGTWVDGKFYKLKEINVRQYEDADAMKANVIGKENTFSATNQMNTVITASRDYDLNYVTFVYEEVPGSGGGLKREAYVKIVEYNSSITDFNMDEFGEGIVKENVIPASGFFSAISPKGDFSRGYEFPISNGNAGADIRVKKEFEFNGEKYVYKGVKVVTLSDDADNLNNLKSKFSTLRLNSSYNNYANTYISTVDGGGNVHFFNVTTPDITGIIFYYEPGGTTNDIPDLDLIGRLDFINTTSEYMNATDDVFSPETADYIPAGKTLSPYVDGAYPYIVRGLTYGKGNNTKTYTCKVTVEKDWKEEPPEEPPEDWEPASGTEPVIYTFTVNVSLNYYRIDYFKMYTIDTLTVNNSSDPLFTVTNTVIQTSDKYKKRFTSEKDGVAAGKNAPILTCTLPTEVNGDDSVVVSGTSTSAANARAEIREIYDNDLAKLARDAGISDFEITYSNEYMYLDGKENMVEKNETTIEIDMTSLDQTTDDTEDEESEEEQVVDGTIDNISVNIDATKEIDEDTYEYTKDIDYTQNLMNYMKPNDKLTDYDDFSGDITILGDNTDNQGDNGVRLASGTIKYKISTDTGFNIGGDVFDTNNYTYQINSTSTVKMDSEKLKEQTKDFGKNNNSLLDESEVRKVNVLTPMNFNSDSEIMETTESVDHTLGTQETLILQKGVEFSVKPDCTSSSVAGYSLSDTDNFVKYYYVMCDFTVSDVKVNGTSKNGEFAPYTAFKIDNNNPEFLAKPVDIIGDEAVSQISNNIYIYAVSINIPKKLENLVKQIFGEGIYRTSLMTVSSNSEIFNSNNINQNSKIGEHDYQSRMGYLSNSRPGAAKHIISKTITTNNIGRIYDFEITDCTDINFKDVFRAKTESDVNKSTGTVYYSGTRKWLVTRYGNLLEDRFNSNDFKTILPLGPNKHVKNVGDESYNTYVFAPKLGYRISYDLKTTGYIENQNADNERYIAIYPRYYYIKKDGTGLNFDIKLYYKDSTGKYRKLTNYIPNGEGKYNVDSGSNYNLYFKPNDGYRYSNNQNVTDVVDIMSKSLERLSISNATNILDVNNVDSTSQSPIVLNNKMMCISNDSFIQSWYGEFKLPNSTIVLEKNGGNFDLNAPSSDGYIGVIFDIYSIDEINNSSKRILSYSKNDKTAGSNSTNTSQWDYEGFLGFNSNYCGRELSGKIPIQLEKGTWLIDNDTYNKIKGTVLLYDTDSRAANDFT